jgi:hypothetical protein
MRALTTAILAGMLTMAAPAFGQRPLPSPAPSAPVEGIDTVTVTGRMVPVPHVGEGAPYYSEGDIEGFGTQARRAMRNANSDIRRCGGNRSAYSAMAGDVSASALLNMEYDAGVQVSQRTEQAQAAVRAAEEVRRKAALGEADMEAVIQGELARQAAMNRLDESRIKLAEAQAMIGDWQDARYRNRPVEWIDLEMLRDRRRAAGGALALLEPAHPPGLSITDIQAATGHDRRGEFLVVRGQLHNDNTRAVQIPRLTAAVLDERGWIVATQTVETGRSNRIAAGVVRPFAMEIRPAPEQSARAVVTFANENAPPPRMSMGVLCPRPESPF